MVSGIMFVGDGYRGKILFYIFNEKFEGVIVLKVFKFGYEG